MKSSLYYMVCNRTSLTCQAFDSQSKSFTMNTFTLYMRNFSLSSRLRAMQCWPKPDYGPLEVSRTSLLNGVRVCSAKPMGAQIGACTILFQGGSRYENNDELGVAHFLRACSAASGCGYSAYSKTRVLQQLGAYITCSNDRQSISYTVRCPTSVFDKIKYYLMDMSARCCYAQHEVDRRKELIKRDLLRLPPEQLVMDLIQKACWGGGLNNSVFCEEGRIDGMSADTMNWFTTSNFRSDGCTVASVGLPFEEVLLMAEKIEPRREKPNTRCVRNSWPRRGFEYHDLGPGSDTWIAVAVPGCATNDLPCLMKHAIVAAACGTGNMQLGQHSQDRAAQPPLGLVAANDIYTDYKAFNVSYCDTGIFGILVKTRSCTAKTAAYGAATFLQNIGSLNNAQIDVGRARLKVDIAIHDDDCVRVSEGLALQIANNFSFDSASNSIDLLNSIPNCEVATVAQNIASKKHQMAVAVVGDLQQVPHDRELMGC